MIKCGVEVTEWIGADGSSDLVDDWGNGKQLPGTVSVVCLKSLSVATLVPSKVSGVPLRAIR